MPIYAYRCSACGHAKDVLQKLSDPVLSICPSCGAEAFAKQLTAAGFQLKGSGWYATDFKGGASAGAAKSQAGETGDGAGASKDGAGSSSPGDGGGAASSTPSASAAPSAGPCGGACACH